MLSKNNLVLKLYFDEQNSVHLTRLTESVEMRHFIILSNGILKSNSSVFPWSQAYISQYSP